MEKKEKMIPVQLRISRQLMDAMDDYRETSFRSRSSVIQEALYLFLKKEGKKA